MSHHHFWEKSPWVEARAHEKTLWQEKNPQDFLIGGKE